MVFDTLYLNFLVDFSEEEFFEDFLMKEKNGVTNWDKDSTYVEYDCDRNAHPCILYSVAFDSFESAQSFQLDIERFNNSKN